jgi:hypothetical protein
MKKTTQTKTDKANKNLFTIAPTTLEKVSGAKVGVEN